MSQCTQLGDEAFIQLAERCEHSLQHLQMDGCVRLGSGGVAALARCSQLRVATMNGCYMVKKEPLTACIASDQTQQSGIFGLMSLCVHCRRRWLRC